MAGFTATDVETYVGQWKSLGATKKSLYAAAASGDETAIEGASPGDDRRWVILELMLDVDTAGETLLVEDESDTAILTFRFPVADTYHYKNLNLEITAEKGFNLDKGTTAIVRGWIVYCSIPSGHPVAGA